MLWRMNECRWILDLGFLREIGEVRRAGGHLRQWLFCPRRRQPGPREGPLSGGQNATADIKFVVANRLLQKTSPTGPLPDAVNAVASICPAERFVNRAPEYPHFSTLISGSNPQRPRCRQGLACDRIVSEL